MREISSSTDTYGPRRARVFTGMVPEQEGQVAQTRENGSGQIGPERLRALHDDRSRFDESDAAGLEPRAARGPLAVPAAVVRVTGFPVAPANRLSELFDPAGRAQQQRAADYGDDEIAAVSATDCRRHAAVVVLAVHAVVVARHVRPEDVVHSRAQAESQRTRRVHHERHANGLNHTGAAATEE